MSTMLLFHTKELNKMYVYVCVCFFLTAITTQNSKIKCYWTITEFIRWPCLH